MADTTMDVEHQHSVGTEGQSFLTRLSTGTGAFDVLRPRRTYYIVGVILVLISILLIIFRGFNLGIDFAGGTKLTFAPVAGQTVDTQQIAQAVAGATGGIDAQVQTVGQSNFQVTTLALTAEQILAAKQAIGGALGIPQDKISDSAVSGTWGAEVSEQAIISVIVFLIAVALFIWIRYERRAAIAAVVSTIQVLIITAGIYALVGFEMTPATVIGLLTILGFSLYDTVVVFDKVQENTRGLTSLTRRTYAEAANLAVNQTLMRSINTSLIALLPVAGLLVAGLSLLGSGTLKDLALVQLVGMLVGAYSSLFVAVPLAVDLRTREHGIAAHTKRVTAKRAADGLLVDAVGDPVGHTTPVLPARKSRKSTSTRADTPTTSLAKAPSVATAEVDTDAGVDMTDSESLAAATKAPVVGRQAAPLVPGMKPGDAPRPGVRPSSKGKRPTGKRQR